MSEIVCRTQKARKCEVSGVTVGALVFRRLDQGVRYGQRNAEEKPGHTAGAKPCLTDGLRSLAEVHRHTTLKASKDASA